MIDVSKGRVRVSPTRLATLKRQLADMDRYIQSIQRQINYFLKIDNRCWEMSSTSYPSLVEARKKADERRKLLRLKIRGYVK